MKIKTITTDKAEDLDKQVNELNALLKIKFTHTHTSVVNNILIYTAVLFYE